MSIIFFLIVGLYKTIQKYEEFTKDSLEKVATSVKKDSLVKKDKKKKITQAELDSIKKELSDKMDNSFIPLPKKAKEKLLEEIDKEIKDSTTLKKLNDQSNNDFNIQFGGDTRLDKFVAYVDKYPDANIDVALDSLGYEKNFSNRFLYTRAKTVHSFTKSKETREQYFNQILSYGSIALFIFLPFFTLFLKFYYIRRKFTYVDHLIFVFHVQTVFFMLFAFHFIFLIFHLKPKLWIFLLLFLLYLFLAMKKFYKQGYIKTFFKFLLVNFSFGFIGIFGVVILFLISFAIF